MEKKKYGYIWPQSKVPYYEYDGVLLLHVADVRPLPGGGDTPLTHPNRLVQKKYV